jgi:two-component system sensor histidine kinase KdpD
MSRVSEQRPDPTALLRQLSDRRRAMLRVYLGYAAGCGATTAMLDEGRRRTGRGTDVVVAAYRVHGEPGKALAKLDVLGGLSSGPRERALDVDAVLARNPEVVCIDDLAALDSQGIPRIEAVPRLLAAGITVLATVHLLSVRSAAEGVSGLLGRPADRPLVDDAFLSLVDELEVVDVPPDELIARIREEEVLTPAQLALAMQRELRPSVLGVLRETALRMIADHVDRQFVQDLRDDGSSLAEVRGRIVLCLQVQPGQEERIRRTAEYARAQDATFTVVTVRPPGLSEEDKALIGAYTTLTHQLHGEFVRLGGRAVAEALAEFIKASMATEVILGHRREPRWRPWDTTTELIRRLQGVDIHILRRLR